MTHDEMIEVIEAHKNGANIIHSIKGRGNWRHDPSPAWDFYQYEYKVQLKPREWWIATKTGEVYETKPAGIDAVLVREVKEGWDD